MAGSAHGCNLISFSVTKYKLTYFLARSFIKLHSLISFLRQHLPDESFLSLLRHFFPSLPSVGVKRGSNAVFPDKLITEEAHTWRKANSLQLCNFNLLFFVTSPFEMSSYCCVVAAEKNSSKRAINIETDSFCHVLRTLCFFCKPKQTKFYKSRETDIEEIEVEKKLWFLVGFG